MRNDDRRAAASGSVAATSRMRRHTAGIALKCVASQRAISSTSTRGVGLVDEHDRGLGLPRLKRDRPRPHVEQRVHAHGRAARLLLGAGMRAQVVHAMRQHHPLRLPRAAAGEEDDVRVALVQIAGVGLRGRRRRRARRWRRAAPAGFRVAPPRSRHRPRARRRPPAPRVAPTRPSRSASSTPSSAFAGAKTAPIFARPRTPAPRRATYCSTSPRDRVLPRPASQAPRRAHSPTRRARDT